MTEKAPVSSSENNLIYAIFRKVVAFFFGIFLAIVVLLTAFAITLNIKPLDITEYIQHFQQHMKVGENSVYIDNAVIFYKGSLRLSLTGVTLRTPENAVLSKVERMDMALSNHNLALGRIVIKHARIEGASLQVGVSEEGFEIASLKLNKKEEKSTPVDIVSLLNDKKNFPALKYLKTVEIGSSNLQINDGIYGDIWSVSNIDGMLEKSATRGTVVDLDVGIQRIGEDFKMPATVSFSHFPGANSADMYIQVDNAHAGILAKYLPPRIQNLLVGEGAVRLGIGFIAGKGISEPYFQADLKNGEFTIDGIYGFPLPFEKLHVKGAYSKEGNHKLSIEEFAVTDDEGYVLTGKGEVSNIREDANLNLFLSSKSMPLRHLLRYLPDQKIGSTTSWINHNVHQAVGTDIRLAYTGPISKFPCKPEDCAGFDGSFDFTDLNLRFMDKITPATDLSGHFIIRDGGIIIQAPKGKISNQNVKDITVSIADIFDKEKKKILILIAKADGDIQGVLDRITELLGEGWFPGTVKGTHESDVKMTLPLQEKITFKDVDFDVKSALHNGEYDVPVGTNKLPFKSDKGKLTIADHRLDIQANGTVSDVPVAVVWKENLLKAGEDTTIALNGTMQEEKLNALARSIMPIESIGDTPFSLLLSKIEKDVYDYELETNLNNTSLIVPLLNWEKVSSAPFNLKARGRADVHGKMFALDSLVVSGEGVEISGSLYLDDVGKTTLTLAPFKLGNTDITAVMSGSKILFEGKSLDVSGLDLLHKGGEESSDKPDRDISFNAKFDSLTMSGGQIQNADIVGNRKDGTWRKFIFSGLTQTGSSVQVDLQEDNLGRRTMKARAANAGEALKTLGLYDKLNDGLLTLTCYMDRGTGADESDGELKITRTKIQDMPILAKLLSLISLEQLLSGGNGIIFDDVVFPFVIKEDKVTINKAVLEGPSIGMRFSGDILTSTNNLNIKGSLIPVQGLNKVVSKLPIVGNILTGSQDGLVVADFKIKGTYDKPDIKVNPLSAVTPGLVKDIFGVFSGDKK